MADAKRIFIKGEVKHNGKTFRRQYVTIGDGPDEIDPKSAARLIELQRAYKGTEAKQAAQEAEELEAEEQARREALAAGATTDLTGTGDTTGGTTAAASLPKTTASTAGGSKKTASRS
jgi:hypothetical protein